jgi:hypothetical protein
MLDLRDARLGDAERICQLSLGQPGCGRISAS